MIRKASLIENQGKQYILETNLPKSTDNGVISTNFKNNWA